MPSRSAMFTTVAVSYARRDQGTNVSPRSTRHRQLRSTHICASHLAASPLSPLLGMLCRSPLRHTVPSCLYRHPNFVLLLCAICYSPSHHSIISVINSTIFFESLQDRRKRVYGVSCIFLRQLRDSSRNTGVQKVLKYVLQSLSTTPINVLDHLYCHCHLHVYSKFHKHTPYIRQNCVCFTSIVSGLI